jgi:hypothetical protein
MARSADLLQTILRRIVCLSLALLDMTCIRRLLQNTHRKKGWPLRETDHDSMTSLLACMRICHLAKLIKVARLLAEARKL